MPANGAPINPPFKDRIKQAALSLEDDLREVVTYLNDEVMPDVRRNGSEALRYAAAELRRLADKVEDANRQTPPAPPPPR